MASRIGYVLAVSADVPSPSLAAVATDWKASTLLLHAPLVGGGQAVCGSKVRPADGCRRDARQSLCELLLDFCRHLKLERSVTGYFNAAGRRISPAVPTIQAPNSKLEVDAQHSVSNFRTVSSLSSIPSKEVMDSHQQFSFGWDVHSQPNNQHGQGFPGGPSNGQTSPSQFAFGPSYPLSIQAGLEYRPQPDGDVPMPDDEVEDKLSPQIAGPEAGKSGTARRAKYGHLNWAAHKHTIKQLYLDEDKTLTETIEMMKRLHSFDAS